MPYKKLLAVVTMMMITGTKADAQQVVTIDELRQIENLIGQKDCGALFSFLVANPHTTSGQDALARELRGFVQNVNSGGLECFSASVAGRQNPNELALSAAPAWQIY